MSTPLRPHRAPPSPLRPAGAILLLSGLLLALAAWVGRPADARPAAGLRALPVHAAQGSERLRFGIYPGGYVGTVAGGGSKATAEDEAARTAALVRLRGTGRQLVLHLYSEWSGDPDQAAALNQATAETLAATRAGQLVELVVRYRPATPTAASPQAFAVFVADLVGALADERGLVSLQIANEVNVAGAPAAADGAYPHARRALIAGVLSASDALRRHSRPDVDVGFNWASAGNTGSDLRFWRGLQARGGARFARAVDWVGADVYPGTFSAAPDTEKGVRTAITQTFRHLREQALPAAGLGDSVALQVSENGFPTSGARDQATQARLLGAAVQAVEAVRERYGVTDYRFFDLRDAHTGGGTEDGYGLLRDDYSEKPAFAVFAALVQRLGR